MPAHYKVYLTQPRIAIQGTEGQTLYQNRCWQEQVNKIKFNQPVNTSSSLSQLQQEQQTSVFSNSNWQPTSEPYPYCLKGNQSSVKH